MPEPISWLIIVLCIVLSFIFSASETALTCCNRFKIQVKADNGSKTAKLLLRLCNKYDRSLTAVLIGLNVAAIALSTVTTVLFLKYTHATEDMETWVSLITSIVLSFVLYIFGDALPKTIARAIPDTISYIVTYFIYILRWILTYIIPLTIIFELLVKGIEKMFKVKKVDEFTEEDFENVVEKVSNEGVLDEEQTEIIQSALEFVDTNVKEVLTPRNKIHALDIHGLTNDQLKDKLINVKYSRIPIYDKEFDNFIGVLNIKTFFKEYYLDPHVSIASILQKPYIVSPDIMIDDLFNGFKKNHTHLALVKDNNGKTIGMVTMEDVLEELVSDISESSPKVRKN
ncbi:MAG: hemolysin family protein [Bacilli bacterium]|nr:hemolysin family protein [Bacilli bacterium]